MLGTVHHLLIQAAANYCKGNFGTASECLHSAADLAMPDGIILPFAENAGTIRDILRQRKEKDPKYDAFWKKILSLSGCLELSQDERSGSRELVTQREKEILDLLEEARVMVDFDERMAAYQTIDNAVVHEDAVTLPLYQRNHLFCLNPRVQGFKVAWNGWSDMSFYSISLNG